jgi:hypothetical protein
VGVGLKAFIKLCKKLGPKNIPLVCIFTPLPPFKVHIGNNVMKFVQLISNAMQRKIMLHLGDAAHGIRAIKFIDLNSGKTGVMMKGVGMKGDSMGGVNIILGRVVRGRGAPQIGSIIS